MVEGAAQAAPIVAVTIPDPVGAFDGPGVVRAAGGLVVRPALGGHQVLLVHRPRYDDWSFPKGKRDGDETDDQTALREVAEETGLRCTLGPELAEVRYHDNRGRPKVVRYWLMTPDDDAPHHHHHRAPGAPGAIEEVDEVRWCTVDDAARLLTYDHDRRLLEHLRSRA